MTAQCAKWIEPGNGLTAVTPGYQCTRKGGHGSGGAYCAQHAKTVNPAQPIAGENPADVLVRMGVEVSPSVREWLESRAPLDELQELIATEYMDMRARRRLTEWLERAKAAQVQPTGLVGDETDQELIQHFLRTCREAKPVGQWPGERLCAAIDRLVANERPFRFIEEADKAPERGHNGRGGD